MQLVEEAIKLKPATSRYLRLVRSANGPIKIPKSAKGSCRAIVITATRSADPVKSCTKIPIASNSSQRIIQPRLPAIQIRRKFRSLIRVPGVTAPCGEELLSVSDNTPA